MTNQIGEERLLIDGELVEATDGRRYDTVNPATEEILGQAADASGDDVDRAVGAARRAFDESGWATDGGLRRRCLLQLQDALEGEREEIRAELVAEVGTPLLVTYGPQLDAPLEDALRWPASMIDELGIERELDPAAPFGVASRRVVWKEPVGVVGAIVPWNFPFEITINKLGPALATGCTVVVKGAPDTPWSATRFGRIIAEKTDIPPGVVNVLTSSDNRLGEALVTDPRVDAISFTGSTATGRRIMEQGASTLKRLFLELGGKSATIFLDDADLATHLPGAAMSLTHAGQGCALPTRVLVPSRSYDEAVDILRDAMAGIGYGDPNDPGNFMGPLISDRQRSRVLGYVEKAVAEGATILLGGARPAHLERGYFVEPTLFGDVNPSSTIAQEEVFGPVISLIAFEDDDEAVAIANNSPYGLSGAIQSADADRALRIAHRIRTGTLMINGGMFYGADAPFGGYKASGVGRQNGIEGLSQYLETKTVAMPLT
jgi:aldehyde dehydrogenase (NAD+)